jgi:molybdopterin-guanine dinucleotide biosynthesis protein A
MQHPHGLFVGCDMPFLSEDLLRHMMAIAPQWDAVIPRTKGGLEPLHAVYAKTCIPAIEQSLARGDRRPVSILPHIRVRYVEPNEIERHDPRMLSFFNINTPDDLAQVLAIKRGHRPRRG